MNDPRWNEGRRNLAYVEGNDRASIVESLSTVAPDLADLVIGFVYGEIYGRKSISIGQRQLTTVAALAAMGGVEHQLQFHIAGALNVGCSTTEIVESMIHLSIYAGFPAALNGIAAARSVFEGRGVEVPLPRVRPEAAAERYKRGWERLRQVDGHLGEAVVNSLNGVSPDLGRFIIEHVFGEIYTRPGLDLLSRELVTVAALTAMGSATPQLKVHMNGFLNVGGTEDQLAEIVTHIAAYAGFPRAINGAVALKDVLAQRAQAAD